MSKLDPDLRTAWCLRRRVSTAGSVDVRVGEEGGRFGNLQFCGSVWCCPICAEKIVSGRRDEVQTALAWGRKQEPDSAGHAVWVVMMTLTARHTRADRLDSLIARAKAAKKMLRQSRAWDNRGCGGDLKEALAGSITVLEITHGHEHGWHPHHHELLFVRAHSEAEAIARVEALRGEWARSLEKVGLTGERAAFDVRGAAQAGNYIAKWGAAEELTLGVLKKDGGGRTPAELLRACTEGDAAVGRLWLEYAHAAKGRRQLVWSRGFKATVGVDEVDDEALAANETEKVVEQEERVVARLDDDVWRGVVNHPTEVRHLILQAAEEGFAAGGFVAAEIAVAQLVLRILSPPERPPPRPSG